MSRGPRRRCAAVLLLWLLLFVPAVRSDTAGIHAGDTATYEYAQVLVNHLPNGSSYQQSYVSQFSVHVVSVNGSASPAVVDYILSYTEFQNVTTTQTGSVNSTYIFNPYDNRTYLGAIGFYPFAYTDLQPGRMANIPVTITITQAPNGTITGTTRIDVTVGRAAGSVTVNYTAAIGTALQPSSTFLRYNATNGVLTYGTTEVSLAGIDRGFTFSLVSYQKGVPPGLPAIVYVIGGAFAALGAVAVADVARGSLRRRRKAKRFGRAV